MKKFKFDLNPTSVTLDPSVGYLWKAIEETKGKLADNMQKLADNMQKLIGDEAQRLVTGARRSPSRETSWHTVPR